MTEINVTVYRYIGDEPDATTNWACECDDWWNWGESKVTAGDLTDALEDFLHDNDADAGEYYVRWTREDGEYVESNIVTTGAA